MPRRRSQDLKYNQRTRRPAKFPIAEKETIAQIRARRRRGARISERFMWVTMKKAVLAAYPKQSGGPEVCCPALAGRSAGRVEHPPTPGPKDQEKECCVERADTVKYWHYQYLLMMCESREEETSMGRTGRGVFPPYRFNVDQVPLLSIVDQDSTMHGAPAKHSGFVVGDFAGHASMPGQRQRIVKMLRQPPSSLLLQQQQQRLRPQPPLSPAPPSTLPPRTRACRARGRRRHRPQPAKDNPGSFTPAQQGEAARPGARARASPGGRAAEAKGNQNSNRQGQGGHFTRTATLVPGVAFGGGHAPPT